MASPMRLRHHPPLVRVLLLLALVGLARPSRAVAGPGDDPRIREAAGFFAAGQAAVKAERFADAIYSFEEAYKRSPREPVIFVLAAAYFRQFAIDRDPLELRRAEQLSRDYLALPDGVADRRAKLIEYLDKYLVVLHQLDQEAAAAAKVPPPPPPRPRTTLVISSPVDGARVSFEGGGEQPTPAVVDTSAGRHAFTVSAPGYQTAAGVGDAIAGDSVSVQVPLVELPATLVVHRSPGATVAIDGATVGTTGAALTSSAGPHRVTVLRRGRYAWQRDVVLERGAVLDLDAPLTVTNQRRASRYVLGGGAALLVAGGATTLLALSAQGVARDLDLRVAGGGTLTEAERLDYNDAIDRRDAWRTATYVLVGASLTAVSTGALLYVFDTPQLDRSGPPLFTPTIGLGTVGVQGRF